MRAFLIYSLLFTLSVFQFSSQFITPCYRMPAPLMFNKLLATLNARTVHHHSCSWYAVLISHYSPFLLFPLIFLVSFLILYFFYATLSPLPLPPLIVRVTGHRPKCSPAPTPSVLFLPIWKSISDADQDVEAVYKYLLIFTVYKFLVILAVYKHLIILAVYSQLCDTLPSYEQWYVSCPPSF